MTTGTLKETKQTIVSLATTYERVRITYALCNSFNSIKGTYTHQRNAT